MVFGNFDILVSMWKGALYPIIKGQDGKEHCLLLTAIPTIFQLIISRFHRQMPTKSRKSSNDHHISLITPLDKPTIKKR
jgi:hypothetical protein